MSKSRNILVLLMILIQTIFDSSFPSRFPFPFPILFKVEPLSFPLFCLTGGVRGEYFSSDEKPGAPIKVECISLAMGRSHSLAHQL